MKNIVIIEKNELVVSLNDISLLSGNKVKSIRDLILRNEKEFQELGLRITKEYDLKSQSEMKLNEEQTTFLMILMRNNPTIVKFKLSLVKQFMKLKDMVCETNKLELQQKETQLQIAHNEIKKEKSISRRYAKKREGNSQTISNIIKEYNIKISSEKLNDELFHSGLLNRTKREVYFYTSSLMNNGTPLLHVDSVLDIVDSLGYERDKGFSDANRRLF